MTDPESYVPTAAVQEAFETMSRYYDVGVVPVCMTRSCHHSPTRIIAIEMTSGALQVSSLCDEHWALFCHVWDLTHPNSDEGVGR